ncbi:AI-2E family transporter [Alkalihalophilus marmarensis]|uniref:AI-2E family transporter n=1 Tax=Alkalihalophilus marmarensis TaxID=521377 RepID=UPI002DBCAD33|nr:AI-2E family transporter [Alkalihalophilus marmarensis]MEC2072147.1 AI-2E family transporter [Alkalihalophilus marmarensis]
MWKTLENKWITRLILILLLMLIVFMAMQLFPLVTPVLSIIKALLLPLSLSFLFTYLLHPLVEGLHEHGLPRSLSVLLVFLALLVTLGLVLMFGVPLLIEQVQHAMTVLPQQITEIEKMIIQIQTQARALPSPIQVHINEWSTQAGVLGAKALDQIEVLALWLIQSIFSLMVVPFLVFYFLKDFDLIEKVSWYLTPRKWRPGLKRYAKDVDHSFGSYIRGQLLVALAVTIISSLGFWLIGVPYPILLGVFMGATEMIPYFGAYIGAVPAIIIALFESWQLALITAGFILILQQIEGNILSPVIVGKTLHLHPILIILALVIGIEAGGVIGLLLAVPALAILKVTLLHLRLYFISH